MHAPILDSDHTPDDLTPDDPSWAAACAEFGASTRAHVSDINPDRLRAAAYVFIDSRGEDETIRDNVVILGSRAPLISALKDMLAALESSDVAV